MKHITLIITLLLLSCTLHAQVTDFEEWKKQKQQEFNNFTAAQQRKFNAFRDSLNAAYAEKMKLSWEKFQLQAAKPVPAKPDPPKPVAKPVEEAPVPATPLPTPVVMKTKVPEGYHIIFVSCITLKSGKKLYAKNYGKRAFPIMVKD